MTLKKRKNERLPERLSPGDQEPEPCSPGSIEQQLDMCETGTLRGDEISYHHGLMEDFDQPDSDPIPLDYTLEVFRTDLHEADREGDELSGDEHSSGFQGKESGSTYPPHPEDRYLEGAINRIPYHQKPAFSPSPSQKKKKGVPRV